MTNKSFPPEWPRSQTATRPAFQTLTDSEIIELAWCDETSFDSIETQTGLAESDVIRLMRTQLKPRSFKLWRKRVSGRTAKHAAKSRPEKPAQTHRF